MVYTENTESWQMKAWNTKNCSSFEGSRQTEMDRKERLKRGDEGLMDEQGERRNILCWQLMKKKLEICWNLTNTQLSLFSSFHPAFLAASTVPTFLQPFFIFFVFCIVHQKNYATTWEVVVHCNNPLRGKSATGANLRHKSGKCSFGKCSDFTLIIKVDTSRLWWMKIVLKVFV